MELATAFCQLLLLEYQHKLRLQLAIKGFISISYSNSY